MRNNRLPYDIQIPEPCAADWQAMQAVSSTSRHCASCARQVHDLSRLSARDVRRLVERTGGDFCGRVTHRADGSLVLREDSTQGSALPGAGFILAAALATAGIATSAQAQFPYRNQIGGKPAFVPRAGAPLHHRGQHGGTSLPSPPASSPLQNGAVDGADNSNQDRPLLTGIVAAPNTSTTLQGQVHAPGSTEVRDATVVLRNPKGREYSGTVSESGHFQVQLPPGKYVAAVSLQGSDGRRWFGNEAVTIQEGSQTRDFQPSEPYTVTAGAPIFVPPRQAPKAKQ